MTVDKYVMVHLEGGTKETALVVQRALGGAFTPRPSTDVFLGPGDPSGATLPPDGWARSFRVDGPGRPSRTAHRLFGEITAEIIGSRDRVQHVVDTLASLAAVEDIGAEEIGGDVKLTVRLRPA